jgi:hypothetical protein
VEEGVRRIVAFLYETPFLDLEIYRLVTILEASPALAEFEGSETDKNQVEFLRRLEFPEVSRIVVSLAAIIRSAIDADPRGYSASYGATLERAVGILVPDETKPYIQEPLRFREACNKVLHADLVDPVRTPDTEALTGELVLNGSYRDKNWEAQLNLKEYALSALYLTP